MVKAEDIIKEQNELQANKKKTYKKILERINSKIKTTSVSNNKGCWYEVPEFILGLPIYKMNECVEYIMKKLKNNGFTVTLINNNVIIISW
jgi:hypothetical protein